jgi:hypothetical protein
MLRRFDLPQARPELDSGGSSGGPRRFRRAAFACSAGILLVIATLFYNGPLFGARPSSPSSGEVEPITIAPKEDLPSKPKPEFYNWHTRSQFRPVNQAVTGKSTADLCNAFPKDLLRGIQPVLKTGNGVLKTRVKTHLESVSGCLDNNLLIFSDLDAEIGGYQVIDVLADLRTEFVQGNDQLESYVLQKELAENGTLESEAASRVKGWETDKFKFLPQVSREKVVRLL